MVEKLVSFWEWLSGRCEVFVSGRVCSYFLCHIHVMYIKQQTVVWSFEVLFERGASSFYSG